MLREGRNLPSGFRSPPDAGLCARCSCRPCCEATASGVSLSVSSQVLMSPTQPAKATFFYFKVFSVLAVHDVISDTGSFRGTIFFPLAGYGQEILK